MTRDQVEQVGKVQREMFQIMVGLRLQGAESVEDFCLRRASKLKRLREELFPLPWEDMVYRAVYTWAGHVSRFSLYDSGRLTYHALMHKSYRRILAESRRGHQGHDGRVRVWRWEAQIYRALGADWFAYAHDRAYWLDPVPSLTEWRASEQWSSTAFYGQLLPSVDPDALTKLWQYHSN